MRLFKSILVIAFMTVVALIYVHQQVELVKLSYAIECKDKKLKEALDHNGDLVYNIDNLESPSRLEQVLSSKKIDVSFPKRSHVVRMTKLAPQIVKNEERVRSAGVERRINILGIFDFFSPKAEAQAREK